MKPLVAVDVWTWGHDNPEGFGPPDGTPVPASCPRGAAR
jgi:hypothetical protein